MDNTIHIAINPSETYILPTTVMLHSLGVNKGEDDIMIHAVCSTELSSENKKILRDEVEKNGMQIEFIVYDITCHFDFNSVKIKRHHLNTFQKLYFSESLKGLSKVLYLDGDMIVRHSLRELWDIDIDGRPLAAVISGYTGTERMYHDMHYDKQDGYLNAGMVLFNLDWHRDNNTISEYNAYVANNSDKLTVLDQTVLANVMHDRWLLIDDIRYNCYQIDPFHKHNNYPHLSKEERNEAFHNPVIVHFPSPVKPWNKYCAYPFVKEWNRYLKETCFRNYKKTSVPRGRKWKILYYITFPFIDFYYRCRLI